MEKDESSSPGAFTHATEWYADKRGPNKGQIARDKRYLPFTISSGLRYKYAAQAWFV
ncbi:MAG: hypothetical protein NVSMB44_25230 [Ktedonobacteraceae bacterium]